jgi:hypothetical protein
MVRNSSRRFGKAQLLLLAGLVVVLIAVLELTNTTHIFHKAKVPAVIPVNHSRSGSPQTVDKSSASSVPPSNTSGTSTTKSSSTGGTTDSSLVLVAPYGTFVSNHRPGQNGSPTEEQSTCITTQGATCYIQFKNTTSGQTTKLPVQVVGADGTTYWTWDASILTSGSWQVTAVASLNSQTKSATDPTQLEIQ